LRRRLQLPRPARRIRDPPATAVDRLRRAAQPARSLPELPRPPAHAREPPPVRRPGFVFSELLTAALVGTRSPPILGRRRDRASAERQTSGGPCGSSSCLRAAR